MRQRNETRRVSIVETLAGNFSCAETFHKFLRRDVYPTLVNFVASISNPVLPVVSSEIVNRLRVFPVFFPFFPRVSSRSWTSFRYNTRRRRVFRESFVKVNECNGLPVSLKKGRKARRRIIHGREMRSTSNPKHV